MAEIIQQFWQNYYDSSRNKIYGTPARVLTASIDVEVDHDGGYGECEYGADVTLTLEVAPEHADSSRYRFFDLEEGELVDLIEQAVEFGFNAPKLD